MTQYLSAYRLVAPRWESGAFSGEGARLSGGRWNNPGHAVVYLGGSRALCALELLVHLTTPASRAKPYRLIEVQIPTTSISHYPNQALPHDWQANPAPKSVTDFGDDWLRTCGKLALSVPSVLIPEENNILLNPQHPDFSKIKIQPSRPFSYDPRLIQS